MAEPGAGEPTVRSAALPRVRPGLEVLAAEGYATIRGHRVGLLSNPSSVLPDLRSGPLEMLAAGVDVAAFFGPEHGLRGNRQAGSADDDGGPPFHGVPVFDVYRKDAAEIAELYKRTGTELAVFDIQDVGARSYTRTWIMYRMICAAALSGIPIVVLDRPSPVGGLRVQGPVLDRAYASGVGLQPIPIQHGMTLGELANLFNEVFVPGECGRRADLTVVPLDGWRRRLHFPDTGLPWVMPSPNMPTTDTATVFAGQAMFQGTLVSEGRGTTRPFELVGAPFIDEALAEALNALSLPGVRFREVYFQPTFSKFSDPPTTCGGVQLHVTEPDRYDSVLTALTTLLEIKRLYPDDFGWTPGGRIDRLTGSARLRTMVDAGASCEDIVASWQDELREFGDIREQYLRYD